MIEGRNTELRRWPLSPSEVNGTQTVAGYGEHPRTLGLSLDQLSHRGPVLGDDLEAVHGRLASSSGEHEPANPMRYPELFLDRSVSDPLISRDDDQARRADERQPHLVESLSRDLGKIFMTGVDHAAVDRSKRFPERQVVLVDKEPDGHDRYATKDRSCSS